MRYRDDNLREALASEYALGTLQGRARQRFERSLKGDPKLRRLVGAWQQRLAPLDEAMPPVQPPARVWKAIEQRIQPRRRGERFWSNLSFWRNSALLSSAATLLLALYVAVMIPSSRQQDMMVVVMADDQSKPAMAISWTMDGRRQHKLRVRVIGHAEMAANTSWELWMLPAADKKPVSLGLISTDETQSLAMPENVVQAINAAYGMAMSVEPAGGSPTGQPTGPVIYQGLATRL